MNRKAMLERVAEDTVWDILIVGGGATGLGAAVDAASRGYKTLLVEQYDFGKGTSSRSTKLVHGGVRYLAQGNIKLVREALRERGWLLKNAPHLTSTQAFVIPVFSRWDKWFYGIGLRIYDWLSGKLSLGKTKMLSKQETMHLLPSVATEKLTGGILYFDGQFNDSRLCIDLATTAAMHGATLVNYCEATGFIKEKKKITGVTLYNNIEQQEITVKVKTVINATGVFADTVMELDNPGHEEMVSPSQGIHLVVDKTFFPGSYAMMIPKTDDGRVLFAVPWQDKVVLGTTDTPVDETLAEPVPLEEEIEFILGHINRYGRHNISRADVKSVFAGLRPLVRSGDGTSTSFLSRDHTLVVSPAGLVTITGGKWTTYRKMAQDAVDNALFVSRQDKRPCVTHTLPIGNPLAREQKIKALMEEHPLWQEKLHPGYPYTLAELVYAVRYEMAVTLEDLLARRTRLLFLDARAAIDCAETAANLMMQEMQQDEAWAREQVVLFKALAKQYLLM